MPIGADPERLDCRVMSLAHRHALSSPHVPPAQHPIAPSTHQQVSALTPGDSKDNTGMSAQRLYAFCALHVPDEHLSAAPVLLACAPTGQLRPIRTPSHARDHA